MQIVLNAHFPFLSPHSSGHTELRRSSSWGASAPPPPLRTSDPRGHSTRRPQQRNGQARRPLGRSPRPPAQTTRLLAGSYSASPDCLVGLVCSKYIDSWPSPVQILPAPLPLTALLISSRPSSPPHPPTRCRPRSTCCPRTAGASPRIRRSRRSPLSATFRRVTGVFAGAQGHTAIWYLSPPASSPSASPPRAPRPAPPARPPAPPAQPSPRCCGG
ncbi:hypothetical protein B0H15DRAFT_847172 [Mycena belliarum]|uniref:Uncharacterized protein n=1 Tax=Mycena belliarum TaxID=1033014 RepID=A0AAD6U582_9AGAR|nr:hypothetical protein B0H15DRAFT_847172 [Mycena belliae]